MTRKFQVVCYIRVQSAGPPMTWSQAVEERKHLEASNPKSFYVIEEVRV